MFFWPKDFTFVCPTEIAAFGALSGELAERGAMVCSVSTDSEYAHLNWRPHNADLRHLPIPMLANVKRELSAAIGILDRAEGVPLGATFHRRSLRDRPVGLGVRRLCRPQPAGGETLRPQVPFDAALTSYPTGPGRNPGILLRRASGSMQDEFARLFHHVKIAHHIPERIRLKLDLGAAGALAASWAQAEALLEQLRRTRGVRSVVVNAIARSCLIEYDQSIIDPTAWVDFVEGKMTEEARMFRSSFRNARANEIAKQ